ncbi:MAG: PD-(D/E)XK nuclease family protein [Phycisphaerales bacterium]
MTDTDRTKRIKLLENLLVDDDLQELEQRLGRFNIFDALGIVRREINHSNFLAWLLDPYGSHGQGDLFLKAALIDLLRQAPSGRRPFSPVEIDGSDLRGVEIRREWKNIDLLITCREPAFVVAIENKVDSGKHSDQLNRYEKAVREGFPDQPPLFVFLTIDGDRPSDEDWVHYSYRDIYRVLTRTAAVVGDSLGKDVAAFLDHYLRLLKGRFMNDPDIDELCKRIYRNHKEAIDVIWERASIRGIDGLEMVQNHLAKSDRWVMRGMLGRYLMWVPKEWVGVFSDTNARPLDSAACDLYIEVEQFGETTQYMAVRLIAGRPNDPSRRAATAEALRAAPHFLTTQRKALSSQWTRFNSLTIGKWEPGDEPPASALNELDAWLAKIDSSLRAMPRK